MSGYNKIFSISAAAAIIFASAALCFADTISLKDGSVLVGKILREDDKKIIFNNAFGLFTIQKNKIVEMHVTEDYRQDVGIVQKLGRTYNENEIKENYDAGQKAKETYRDTDTAIDVRWWNGSAFTLGGFYFTTTGKMNSVLPSGYCMTISYENRLNFLRDGEKRLWMPALRAEGGYMIYRREPASITGPMLIAGPAWRFNVVRERYGTLSLSILTGATFLKIKYEKESDTSNTFLSHAGIGYEYRLGSALIFIQGRYKFIYDREVDFNGIGFGAGAGAVLW